MKINGNPMAYKPYSREWLQSYHDDVWKKICSLSDEELTQRLAKQLHISTEQVDSWAQELGDSARAIMRDWLFRKRR